MANKTFTYDDLLKYAEECGFEDRRLPGNFRDTVFHIIEHPSEAQTGKIVSNYQKYGFIPDGRPISIFNPLDGTELTTEFAKSPKGAAVAKKNIKASKFLVEAKKGKKTLGYIVMTDRAALPEFGIGTAYYVAWPLVTPEEDSRAKYISYFLLLSLMRECRERDINPLFTMLGHMARRKDGIMESQFIPAQIEYIGNVTKPLGDNRMAVEIVIHGSIQCFYLLINVSDKPLEAFDKLRVHSLDFQAVIERHTADV